MEASPTFDLPETAAPRIRALYDYWRAIHPRDGGLPGRRHLDPLDIPRLLPNIWMIDVRRQPLRFRFRLVGTEIVRFTGHDATGQWLDQVYPGYEHSEAFAAHRGCVLHGRPGYRKSVASLTPRRRSVEAERLYLPLAEDGMTVDILLSMSLYSDEPPPAA